MGHGYRKRKHLPITKLNTNDGGRLTLALERIDRKFCTRMAAVLMAAFFLCFSLFFSFEELIILGYVLG